MFENKKAELVAVVLIAFAFAFIGLHVIHGAETLKKKKLDVARAAEVRTGYAPSINGEIK